MQSTENNPQKTAGNKKNRKIDRNIAIKDKIREQAKETHKTPINSAAKLDSTNFSTATKLFDQIPSKATFKIKSNGSQKMSGTIQSILTILSEQRSIKLIAKNKAIPKCISIIEIIKRQSSSAGSCGFDSQTEKIQSTIRLYSEKPDTEDPENPSKKNSIIECVLSYPV